MLKHVRLRKATLVLLEDYPHELRHIAAILRELESPSPYTLSIYAERLDAAAAALDNLMLAIQARLAGTEQCCSE